MLLLPYSSALLYPSIPRVQNSLARAVVKAPKPSHITPIPRTQHSLKITQRIEYKLLSLTYKVLTITQPSHLHNIITVQPPRSTRSSSLVTLACPSTSSSLRINGAKIHFTRFVCISSRSLIPVMSHLTSWIIQYLPKHALNEVN